MQNLAKSITASENTRKYALGVIEGSKPTLYAVVLRAKPNYVTHQLNGLIEGVAHLQTNSAITAFHPPKPEAVRNIVLHARVSNFTDLKVLFVGAMRILERNCKTKCLQ